MFFILFPIPILILILIPILLLTSPIIFSIVALPREEYKKSLISLDVDSGRAYAWSRTHLGGWRVAQSPILTTTITLDKLKKRGYEAMLDGYLRMAPQLNEHAVYNLFRLHL